MFATSRRFLMRNNLKSFINGSKCRYSSYEGDGKTKVTVLNKDHDMGLMVNSFSVVSAI